MSSTNKTEHLQLNQWVGTDPFRMADFNEDNAKIDAAVQANTQAIAANATAISNNAKSIADNAKAITTNIQSIANNAQAIATAKQELTDAVAELAASGLKFHYGTYTGTGKYGQGNPTVITFPFPPKLVLISMASNGDCSGPLIRDCVNGLSFLSATYPATLSLTWSDNTLRIQNHNGTQQQLNHNNVKYHYCAFG